MQVNLQFTDIYFSFFLIIFLQIEKNKLKTFF